MPEQSTEEAPGEKQLAADLLPADNAELRRDECDQLLAILTTISKKVKSHAK